MLPQKQPRKMTRTRCCVLLAVALMIPSADVAGAPPPGTNGRIAFYTERDGSYTEIYTMNAGGSGLLRLTFTADQTELYPEWSPNGLQLAFTRTSPTSNGEIWVMDSDGSDQTQLTNNSTHDDEPEWSPDGTKIAFFRSDLNSEVYVMNANGTGEVNLTNSSDADDFGPAWRPDGTKIAFVSDQSDPNCNGCNWDIYTMNADGSMVVRITTDAADDRNPDWSPDGTKIVFDSSRSGSGDIYVMDSTGANVTQLTTNAARDAAPSWSPDGTQIAFWSLRDGGDPEIYKMNADGSGQERLTTSTGTDAWPDWQRAGGPPYLMVVTRTGPGLDR